jgi:hypothetical protein
MPQNPFAYLIGILLTALTCAIAYAMGRNNIRFFGAKKKKED